MGKVLPKPSQDGPPRDRCVKQEATLCYHKEDWEGVHVYWKHSTWGAYQKSSQSGYWQTAALGRGERIFNWKMMPGERCCPHTCSYNLQCCIYQLHPTAAFFLQQNSLCFETHPVSSPSHNDQLLISHVFFALSVLLRKYLQPCTVLFKKPNIIWFFYRR